MFYKVWTHISQIDQNKQRFVRVFLFMHTRIKWCVHVHNNQHYRWISVCSGASMGATLTRRHNTGLEYILSLMWSKTMQWEKMSKYGEYLSATVAVRVPIVGRWKLAGISGKYPQVSGVSIPQISSYIHVTPHLWARGTLNSVTCQYPDILIREDLKCSMFIDLRAPHRD